MEGQKRLRDFQRLSLLDKLKTIHQHLISPRFSSKMHGLHSLEDTLLELNDPVEQEQFLGHLTGSFSNGEYIRLRAARIMENIFPDRWKYIGHQLNSFYANPNEKTLKQIVAKAIDLLQTPEIPKTGVNDKETPPNFQPSHRHGLDLLSLVLQENIFSAPHEVNDSSKIRMKDFLNKEFQNIQVGQILYGLLRSDTDPFVLRRILNFFRVTALDIDASISTFDMVLEYINPPATQYGYLNNPRVFYTVVDYGINCAAGLYANPWFETVYSICGQTDANLDFKSLETFTHKIQDDGWPSQREWDELLSTWGSIDNEIGNQLQTAYHVANKNRGKLIDVLIKVVKLQNNFDRKPERRKDLNRQSAIVALDKLGAFDVIVELKNTFEKGMSCPVVSFTIPALHQVLLKRFAGLKDDQRHEIIEYLSQFTGSRSSIQKKVTAIMGQRPLYVKSADWSRESRSNVFHITNYLSTLFGGKMVKWDLGLMIDDILAVVKLDTSEPLYELLKSILIARECLDDGYDRLGADVKALETHFARRLEVCPDKNSLLQEFTNNAFFYMHLNLVDTHGHLFPTDAELSLDNYDEYNLKAIKDHEFIRNLYHHAKSPHTKLKVWIEDLLRNSNGPFLDCPFAYESQERHIQVISEISEVRWREVVPVLMSIPASRISGVLDLIEALLKDSRRNTLYGLNDGGLDKYVRVNMSGEVAYHSYKFWATDTGIADPTLASLAWINMLRAAEYATREKRPFPPDDRSESRENYDFKFYNHFMQLEKERAVTGEIYEDSVVFDDPTANHYDKTIFSKPLNDLKDIWKVVYRLSEFPESLLGSINNKQSADNELSIGDLVLGTVENVKEIDDNFEFSVSLGDGFPEALWKEPDLIDYPNRSLMFLNRKHLFLVSGKDNEGGKLLLSKNAFLGAYKDSVGNSGDPIIMNARIVELGENGNIIVLLGHLKFEIEKDLLSWNVQEDLTPIISYMQKQQIPLRVCLHQDRKSQKTLLSVKNQPPVFDEEDLAMIFGANQFILNFVESSRNDLIFEIQPFIAANNNYNLNQIPLGTLCKLSTERLIDKFGKSFHPLLSQYPPKAGESYVCQWRKLDGDITEQLLRGEGVKLEMRRKQPYQFHLHHQFRVNSIVTIKPSSNQTWGQLPENVQIIRPVFEDDLIAAKIDWAQVDSVLSEHMSSLSKIEKLRAKIIAYKNGVPIVTPVSDEFEKFNVGESYSLIVKNVIKGDGRRHILLSHWATNKKILIYEDDLAYNPNFTVSSYKEGDQVDALFVGDFDGVLRFSLRDEKRIETLEISENVKSPLIGAYLGWEKDGFKEYAWIEQEPGYCIRIARKLITNFSPKNFHVGDHIRITENSNVGNFKIEELDDGVNHIRSIVEDDHIVNAKVLPGDNQLAVLSAPNIQAIIGKIKDDQQIRYQDWSILKVKIDNVRINFNNKLPKVFLDVYPVVEAAEKISIEEIKDEFDKKKRMYIWGKIKSASKEGVSIESSKYSNDVDLIVPYNLISNVVSRCDYQYFQKNGDKRKVYGFLVKAVYPDQNRVILSMREQIAEDFNKSGNINNSIGIDKGISYLIGIGKDNRDFYFETSNLGKCRVRFEDLDITKEKINSYFNYQYQFGAFEFEIHKDKLNLKKYPVISFSKKIDKMPRHVILGRLSSNGEEVTIKFIGKILERFPQLEELKSKISDASAEKIDELLNQNKIVSFIFDRFDSETGAAYFKLWEKKSENRLEMDAMIRPPKNRYRQWTVDPQALPSKTISFDHLTAVKSLELFGIFEPQHPCAHIETLNISTVNWYRVVHLIGENYNYYSLVQREPMDVNLLDQHIQNTSKVRQVVLTIIDKKADMAIFERSPGMIYNIPLHRFDKPGLLDEMKRGDRIIVDVEEFDKISYKFFIRMILDDKWAQKLFQNNKGSVEIHKAGYIKKQTFTFKSWNKDKSSFSVQYTQNNNPQTIWIRTSALKEEQRSSYLWLMLGDILSCNLWLVHENLAYSEHASIEIIGIKTGTAHDVIYSDTVEIGKVIQGVISGYDDEGFAVSVTTANNVSAYLPKAEFVQAHSREYAADDLIGLSLPLVVTTLSNKECIVSYDKYISLQSKKYKKGYIIPVEAVRNCGSGIFAKALQLVVFIPYKDLLNGYRGMGWMPENTIVDCQIVENNPTGSTIQFSHCVLDNTYLSPDLLSANIVWADPQFLIVNYQNNFGVISREYISKEANNRINTSKKIQIKPINLGKTRHFIVDFSADRGKDEEKIWQNMCRFFPSWVESILTTLWDYRKFEKADIEEHDWVRFGNQLTNAQVPISGEMIPIVARFLADPNRQLQPESEPIPMVVGQTEWGVFISSLSKVLLSADQDFENQSVDTMIAAVEYFLSVEEHNSLQAKNSKFQIDWEYVLRICEYIASKRPGLINISVGKFVASKQINPDGVDIALIVDIISKLRNNFDVFLTPFFPDWQTDILNEAVLQTNAPKDLLQRMYPKEFNKTTSRIEMWIENSGRLKTNRLYYLLACISFASQDYARSLKFLKMAKMQINKERDSRQEHQWEKRIEFLRLCVHYESDNLYKASGNLPQDDFVSGLKRYFELFQPEQESDPKQVLFALGLANVLDDYTQIDHILRNRMNTNSFVMQVFKCYLNYLQGRADSCNISLLRIERDELLRTNRFLPEYLTK